jgi:hypothetical protein
MHIAKCKLRDGGETGMPACNRDLPESPDGTGSHSSNDQTPAISSQRVTLNFNIQYSAFDIRYSRAMPTRLATTLTTRFAGLPESPSGTACRVGQALNPEPSPVS